MVHGKPKVERQMASMGMNALIAKSIFDKNPDRDFYYEESFTLDWMYPYLSPHGLLMKLNRQPLNEMPADEIQEHLNLYQAAVSTDRAGFAKRVHASIEKVKTHSILQKIRASEARFEVSPTLKLLFSAEEIQSLTGLYERMAAGEATAPPPAETAEEDSE